MDVLGIEWPFLCASALMIVAGISQIVQNRVPNSITLGGLGAALLACMATPHPASSVGSALLCAIAGFALMIFPYAIGGLGAGCVKTQAAFGAWVGLGMSLRSQSGASLTALSSIAGAALTAVCIGVWYLQLQLSDHQSVAFTIEERERFASRQPALFPAQLTLSLGSVAFLIFSLTSR